MNKLDNLDLRPFCQYNVKSIHTKNYKNMVTNPPSYNNYSPSMLKTILTN